MKKILTIPIALLMLLLLAACEDTGRGELNSPDDTPITIGNITVAGQADAATRAIDDDGVDNGLDTWYPGDELRVESGDIGTYTRTPHGTWKVKDGTTVKQVSEVTGTGSFAVIKGSSTYDQSNWKDYHRADVIDGKLELDRTTGQLYTEDDEELNHMNTDVVITLTRGTGWATDAAWQNHIRHASITIHGIDTDDGNKPLAYTPWLATVVPSKGEPGDSGYKPGSATLRVHIYAAYVPASTKKIITITPADGSNPITGTYTADDTEHDPDGMNQRLAIGFTYDYKRNLTGTGTVIPWTDGGTENLEHLGWDGYDMVIRTADDLKAFRNAVNGGETALKAIQVRDIDISGSEWEPIGKSGTNASFTGTYNGNGHTISGLTITGIDEYRGLFGYTRNATLTGITIRNPQIEGSKEIGALIGYTDNSTISNCHVIGGSVEGTAYIGGIVGGNIKSTIVACHSSVNVEGSSYDIGGLVGFNNGGTIRFCYSTGDAKCTNMGTPNIGGLVGNNNNGTNNIQSCYATGTVTVANTLANAYCGSLVGLNGTNSTVRYCNASGIVKRVNGTEINQIVAGDQTNVSDITTLPMTNTAGILENLQNAAVASVTITGIGTFTSAMWNADLTLSETIK